MSIQENFDEIMEVAKSAIIKDSDLMDSYENNLSQIQSRLYLNAVYNRDDNSINEYHNNTKLDINTAYKEHNTYVSNLYKNNGIPPYKVRLSDDLEILKMSVMGSVSSIDIDDFMQVYSDCLTYFKQVLYTNMFADNTTEYRKFIKFFVMFMSIERYLDITLSPNDPNFQINTDQGIDTLLDYYDIGFVKDLPTTYKKKIIYNMSYILRNKGTNNAFLSIFDIFGLSDIEISKYYLYKKNNGLDIEPDLFFYKIPFDTTDVAHFLKNQSETDLSNRRETFEAVTSADDTWYATEDEVKAIDFNWVATKYMDVQSVRDIQRLSTDLAFWGSMIQSIEEVGTSNIMVESDGMEYGTLSLFQSIILLNMLLMKMLGYEDIIPTGSDMYTIYKFNMDIDEDDMSDTFKNYYANTYVPLGLITDTITNQDASDTFSTNSDLYINMLDRMYSTTDVNEFWDLESDIQKLFIGDVSLAVFDGYDTYESYLQDKAPQTKTYLAKVSNFSSDEIQSAISTLVSDIESYVDNDRLILTSTDSILTYIKQLIVKFKSFTVDLKDLSVNYYADSPQNTLKLFDMVEFFKMIGLTTLEDLKDLAYINKYINAKDFIQLKEILVKFKNIEYIGEMDITDVITALKTTKHADYQYLEDKFTKDKSISREDFITFGEIITKFKEINTNDDISFNDIMASIKHMYRASTQVLDDLIHINKYTSGMDFNDFNELIIKFKSIENFDDIDFGDLNLHIKHSYNSERTICMTDDTLTNRNQTEEDFIKFSDSLVIIQQ